MILNPSAEAKTYADTQVGEILLQYNAHVDGASIKLGGRSCMIYKV